MASKNLLKRWRPKNSNLKDKKETGEPSSPKNFNGTREGFSDFMTEQKQLQVIKCSPPRTCEGLSAST